MAKCSKDRFRTTAIGRSCPHEAAEIRRRPARCDFTCQTLDEAYTFQHNRIIAGRIEDHLNLADWCLRHQLLGYAAREITSAMQLDAKNPRVAQLDGRLQRSRIARGTDASRRARCRRRATRVAR